MKIEETMKRQSQQDSVKSAAQEKGGVSAMSLHLQGGHSPLPGRAKHHMDPGCSPLPTAQQVPLD